jgi:hypothetical protein
MHASHMLGSRLGFRENHKPNFSPIVAGLYEMSHTNFRENLFQALLG